MNDDNERIYEFPSQGAAMMLIDHDDRAAVLCVFKMVEDESGRYYWPSGGALLGGSCFTGGAFYDARDILRSAMHDSDEAIARAFNDLVGACDSYMMWTCGADYWDESELLAPRVKAAINRYEAALRAYVEASREFDDAVDAHRRIVDLLDRYVIDPGWRHCGATLAASRRNDSGKDDGRLGDEAVREALDEYRRWYDED